MKFQGPKFLGLTPVKLKEFSLFRSDSSPNLDNQFDLTPYIGALNKGIFLKWEMKRITKTKMNVVGINITLEYKGHM